MYVAGSYRDHVTRYNHKDTSRWMTPPRPYRPRTKGQIVDMVVISAAVSALIVFGVMVLQMM